MTISFPPTLSINSTFQFVSQESKASFVKEVKTDVTLALKNVLVKFAVAFSDSSERHKVEPEEGTDFMI